MKKILCVVGLLLSATVNATMLQLDITATPVAPSHWTFSGTAPSQFSTSLLFDTATATHSLLTQTDGGGVSCLGHLSGSVSGSILDMSAGGTSLLGNVSGAGALTGDHPGSSCNGSQQSLFSSLSIDAGDTSLFFSFDSLHQVGLATLLASADPISDLLLSISGISGGFLQILTPDGSGAGLVGPSDMSIHRHVPEPGTVALFGAALLACAALGRRKRTLRGA